MHWSPRIVKLDAVRVSLCISLPFLKLEASTVSSAMNPVFIWLMLLTVEDVA